MVMGDEDAVQGRKRNIFQSGQSHLFPGMKCFFSVENFHFQGSKGVMKNTQKYPPSTLRK